MTDLHWDRNFALEQAGDEEEILRELLDLFQKASRSDCAKIRAGIRAQDAAMVADAAHSIKGAAASLGIESIRNLSHEIEKAGKAGNIELATGSIEKLEKLLRLAGELR